VDAVLLRQAVEPHDRRIANSVDDAVENLAPPGSARLGGGGRHVHLLNPLREIVRYRNALAATLRRSGAACNSAAALPRRRRIRCDAKSKFRESNAFVLQHR